jgi:hypothetical protein
LSALGDRRAESTELMTLNAICGAMMSSKQWLIIGVLLLADCGVVFAQASAPAATPARVLRNNDVLRMMSDGLPAADIITKIQASNCHFDIYPSVLQDLKRRGVPTVVLQAMKSAPSGPPARFALKRSDTSTPTTRVRIPLGTVVEVETAFPISSANTKVGSPITFQVTRRVFINDVLVIDRDAVARARVIKTRPAGRWGRAGMLAWKMEYVVGVDGTRIPIQVTGNSKGNNRGAVVAGGLIATGALFFPYTSPVGLIWGLKKGDEAVLRGSKLFVAVIGPNVEVAGFAPKKDEVTYHDPDVVKASLAPPTETQFERGGFKPSGSFHPRQ